MPFMMLSAKQSNWGLIKKGTGYTEPGMSIPTEHTKSEFSMHS